MPGLLRATLTLLAGGVVAQALPLALGPLLTRLYSPQEFGHYHLFAAVAANIGVVACARYEFALPLAGDAAAAHALRALCLRVLAGVTVLTALGTALWWWAPGQGAWVGWLPAAVASLGLVSLATLWATRAQRFRALAAARVVQHGGGALAQAAAGLAQWGVHGVHGLIVGPIAAAAAAAAVLRLPLSPRSPQPVREVAQRWRAFPLLNTPHAFAGALQDTLAVGLIAASQGAAAAGFWGLALRYLKAPATLVGGAVSQALYARLGGVHAAAPGATRVTPASRRAVVQVMLALAAVAAPLVLALWVAGPWAFEQLFGRAWQEAGHLARALALYIGLHFVASPLGVVTMAWDAQAWALKLALVGQVVFVLALAAGLHWGGLEGAGWAVSLAMLGYFGWYFVALARWPVVAP